MVRIALISLLCAVAIQESGRTLQAPKLIADGYVKNLNQQKRNVTPEMRLFARGASAAGYLTGCLAADGYWKVPIAAGQRYIVTSAISTRCDSRGWSCDNWSTRSGPAGVPNYYVAGSLGYPHSTIGTLIGAVSSIDSGNSMDPTQAARIFSPAVRVAEKRDDSAPINGFLYLIFNDTWSWGDNKGAIEVTLQLF